MLAQNLFRYWTCRIFSPELALQSTYRSFQKLLEYDGKAHEEMAEIESLYYRGIKEDFCRIRKRYSSFSENVRGMVESLEEMAPGSHIDLKAYYKKFDFYSRFLLEPPPMDVNPPFVYSLPECSGKDAIAGGKASQLATLSTELSLPVPEGFVISASSFNYFIEYNNLRKQIDSILCSIDPSNSQRLLDASAELIKLIMCSTVPSEISEDVLLAGNRYFSETAGGTPLVAVRSSAINEDGACSFAGQYLSLLDVSVADITDAWLQVLSSKYTPEALAYRINSGFGDEETGMAVLVIEMLDAASSGVLYTDDPSGKQQNEASVHAVRGLGDALVSGLVTPECYKKSVPMHDDASRILKQTECDLLFKHGKSIAEYFRSPRDIEWSISKRGKLVFLQNRALAIHSSSRIIKTFIPQENRDNELLFKTGTTAAAGQSCGTAYVVDSSHPLENVKKGDILILTAPEPSAVRVLKQVSGVIAELGSVAGHFSTVCREFEIPLLLAVGDKIKAIRHGEVLTLSAENCAVWRGDCLQENTSIPAYKKQSSLPFFKKLENLLGFITPLRLINPEAEDFVPESCRSLHDIIRFSHEQAVRLMFSLGEKGSSRSKGKRKLVSNIPLDVFLLDVGGGFKIQEMEQDTIHLDEVCSIPFLALWQGLNHPAIEWKGQSHFDWKSFDEIALAGGVASTNASEFASFAVLAGDYVNLNMRFGYHFTLVDALCCNDASKNYCQLRFAGGGGDYSGRSLRIQYVDAILGTIGFQTTCRGDLLDARIQQVEMDVLSLKLQFVGRLLGETKLLDMRLKDKQMLEKQLDKFWQTRHEYES